MERYGAESVLVTSFSRAAAAELTGRDLPISAERIGTLHAHCWRALGGPEIAESHVDEWNRDHPSFAITPSRRQKALDGEEAIDDDDEQAKGGDALLQQLSRFRGLMLPKAGWPATLRAFGKLWSEYKHENGLLDFTDLIENCLRDVAIAPKNPSVIFADESQDLNKLQLTLVRKWGERASYFIVAGDDDQASLPGSEVLIEGRKVLPVECLDPAHHRLVSYSTVHSQLRGLRKGCDFEIQPSMYRGQAARVCVAGRATRTTHNHPWLFRWTAAAQTQHVVYLMQKGRSFRVGWCKLMRSDNCSHLGVRAQQERAEAAWILKLCESRSEASLWESYVAAEFGITTALWHPIHDQRGGHYTPEVIAALTEMLGDQTERARCCLEAFGRDINLPFYEKGKANRYGAQINKTAATNLLPNVMAVPVVERVVRDGVVWRPIDTVERFPYEGCVYGLSVPPEHTYVADGIVTHNCIYSFTGATPEAFLDPDIPDDHKIILKQSYRVPRAVHRLAEGLITQVTRRQAKEYLPRNEAGVVRWERDTYKHVECAILRDAEKHLTAGKTVMFLASCSYMLRPLIQVLRMNGIPFHNPYRKSNGFWNPLRLSTRRTTTASRILALLVAHPQYGDEHRPWTNGDLAQWAEVLQAKGILRHGVKAMLKTADLGRPATMERLDEIFEPAALDSLMAAWEGSYRDLLNWWRARVTSDISDRVKYPAEVATMRGPQALVETPKLIVGTVHSVKGGEADVVYLFPDLSQAADAEYGRGGANRDAVIRLFYVGVTRARDSLHICQRVSGMAVAI